MGINNIHENYNFEVNVRNIKYRGSLKQHIDRHIFFFGAYAENEIKFLVQAVDFLRGVRGSVVMLDVGANVGQHSLCLASKVDAVHAFEPNPDCVLQFSSNLNLNGIGNVHVHQIALGESDGAAELGSGLVGNNGSRSLRWSLNDSDNISVEVRNGDKIIEELLVPNFDLLKIDVEGYEKNVLHGLSKSICKSRPIIMMELLGGIEKSGFRDEDELRNALYPDHVLYRLGDRDDLKIEAFDWLDCELIVIPSELESSFREFNRTYSP
jgi:FkbM family methyltransferase